MTNDQLNPIHSFFNQKTVLKMAKRIRIPVALAAAAWLAWHIQPEWFWPGVAVSGFGELLQLWCFSTLHKQKTLATNGLYKVVRNPMYLARFFLVLGLLMFLGSPINGIASAIYVVLYYYYMVNRVRREEARLTEIFSEPYREYCRRVDRFIPFRGINPDGTFWFCRMDYFIENHGPWNGLGQLAYYVVCYVLTFQPFG